VELDEGSSVSSARMLAGGSLKVAYDQRKGLRFFFFVKKKSTPVEMD